MVAGNVKTNLQIVVHYPAAAEPFKDKDAVRSETVGQLKARVLTAFGLSEGATSDGNAISFTLYQRKTPLENPAQLLGELAGDHPVLQLKLSQQLTQG